MPEFFRLYPNAEDGDYLGTISQMDVQVGRLRSILSAQKAVKWAQLTRQDYRTVASVVLDPAFDQVVGLGGTLLGRFLVITANDLIRDNPVIIRFNLVMTKFILVKSGL